jgi:hypothetical protein
MERGERRYCRQNVTAAWFSFAVDILIFAVDMISFIIDRLSLAADKLIVLNAFKEQDPNGNAKRDEIPMSFVGGDPNPRPTGISSISRPCSGFRRARQLPACDGEKRIGDDLKKAWMNSKGKGVIKMIL